MQMPEPNSVRAAYEDEYNDAMKLLSQRHNMPKC